MNRATQMLVVIISRAHPVKLRWLFKEMTNLHSHLDFYCQRLWLGFKYFNGGVISFTDGPAGVAVWDVLWKMLGNTCWSFAIKPGGGILLSFPQLNMLSTPSQSQNCQTKFHLWWNPTRLTCSFLVNHPGFSGWNPAALKQAKLDLTSRQVLDFNGPLKSLQKR